MNSSTRLTTLTGTALALTAAMPGDLPASSRRTRGTRRASAYPRMSSTALTPRTAQVTIRARS
ncbi:hypothetical protein SVIOM342S_01256 [Streptomyces violaceorubidus]